MITLHTFGPAFGSPDPSPFVIKAHILLKLAGQAYKTVRADVRKAPKKKLPFIVDDGETICDSTFIRWHLETKYAVDLDAGLSAQERATAWAFEKLAEDHLYWSVLHERWEIDENFDKGPRMFFAGLPAVIRGFVTSRVRKDISARMWQQGVGRHSQAEIDRLGLADLSAISRFLGDKPFLMGDSATSADASVGGFVIACMPDIFESAIFDAARNDPTLVAYADRIMAQFFDAK